MGSYIPTTQTEREQMLSAIGVQSVEELFAALPQAVRCGELNIPQGKSELEVRQTMENLAGRNTVFRSIFRGAGAYRHYIPSIVKTVTSKEEFVTAYTPYQAEISQGILQAIFEYQTMICRLTGMDASNASVYDGAAAAAEAVAMCRERSRTKALVSACAHPDMIAAIRTYCMGADAEVVLVPERNGVTDLDALRSLLDDKTACLYLQQPNFFGQLEDATALGALAHEHGAKFIMGSNPISLGLLQTPAACGADIAVGEGQPLGLPLSFGGPYLGFMACTSALVRRLPGRIAGETTDADGKRAFVLTLQAREQHIRREKASSSLCSNQALCALTASVYLTAMGPQGLHSVAQQCYSKAHYAAHQLSTVSGVALAHSGDFFHEFVTTCPVEPSLLLSELGSRGILGGLPVEGGILWCVTELNTKDEIDLLVQAVLEVCE